MKRSKLTPAFAALALSLSSISSFGSLAMAQSSGPYGAETSQPASGGGLLRQNNITSTGATVPHPGVPQTDGPTPVDNGMDRQNQKIENSICKGC